MSSDHAISLYSSATVVRVLVLYSFAALAARSVQRTRVNSDRALLGVWPMSGTIREGGGLEQRTGTGIVLWCKVYS